jgi:hypothetical protein
MDHLWNHDNILNKLVGARAISSREISNWWCTVVQVVALVNRVKGSWLQVFRTEKEWNWPGCNDTIKGRAF